MLARPRRAAAARCWIIVIWQGSGLVLAVEIAVPQIDHLLAVGHKEVELPDAVVTGWAWVILALELRVHNWNIFGVIRAAKDADRRVAQVGNARCSGSRLSAICTDSIHPPRYLTSSL